MSESAEYLDPYVEAVARHGAGFKATLWNSANAQVRRFEILVGMADLSGKRVLDAGCGAGDLATFLSERGVDFVEYIGIDGIGEQIEAARDRALPRCTFEAGDFVSDNALFTRHAPDYICFSGSLNTMDEATVETVVRRAFEAAARGVVFNFLSNRPHERFLAADLTPARRFDTVAILDFAMHLSPRVRFRQDYLDGHDATILIETVRSE